MSEVDTRRSGFEAVVLLLLFSRVTSSEKAIFQNGMCSYTLSLSYDMPSGNTRKGVILCIYCILAAVYLPIPGRHTTTDEFATLRRGAPAFDVGEATTMMQSANLRMRFIIVMAEWVT